MARSLFGALSLGLTRMALSLGPCVLGLRRQWEMPYAG
jgi:hypothetical protein